MGKDVLYYDFKGRGIRKICSIEGSRLMGIARQEDTFYFANHFEILKYERGNIEKLFRLNPNPKCHHMILRDNKLIIVATMMNGLCIFDLDTKEVRFVKIAEKYKHMNCIFEKDDKYYVTFNQSNIRENEDYSCVCVLDKNFKEIDRFEYGWQSHGFCIIDDIKYTTCNYWSGQKDKKHPLYGALMVDGEVIFKFDEDEFFKDISIDRNNIYVCGATAKPRELRKYTDGVIYRFNRDLKVQEKIVLRNSGDLSGCLLSGYDFTD